MPVYNKLNFRGACGCTHFFGRGTNFSPANSNSPADFKGGIGGRHGLLLGGGGGDLSSYAAGSIRHHCGLIMTFDRLGKQIGHQASTGLKKTCIHFTVTNFRFCEGSSVLGPALFWY